MRDAIVMLVRRVRPDMQVVELDRLGAVDAAVLSHGMPELICLDLKLPDTHDVYGIVWIQRAPAQHGGLE